MAYAVAVIKEYRKENIIVKKELHALPALRPICFFCYAPAKICGRNPLGSNPLIFIYTSQMAEIQALYRHEKTNYVYSVRPRVSSQMLKNVPAKQAAGTEGILARSL